MRLVTTRKKPQVKPRELAPISCNPELQQLSALYTRISQAAPSNKLIAKISKRLKTSRSNQHPIKLTELASGQEEESMIQVVVAKVLDDDEAVVLPKLKIICLKISKSAKAKIERFGGEVYKLDELFTVVKNFDDVKLVIGDVTKRRVFRYHGSPGDKTKNVLPKIISKKKDVTKRPS